MAAQLEVHMNVNNADCFRPIVLKVKSLAFSSKG